MADHNNGFRLYLALIGLLALGNYPFTWYSNSESARKIDAEFRALRDDIIKINIRSASAVERRDAQYKEIMLRMEALEKAIRK